MKSTQSSLRGTELFWWIGFAALTMYGTNVSRAATELRVTDSRPNIILIVADDLGFSDLGCYGGEIETPNLDRLAHSGMRFSQFYNCAKCTQTRATLLTGLYHQQTNCMREGRFVTLAELLRNTGYRTLMTGKWHLPSTPMRHGFDRFFGFLGGAINYFTGKDFGTGENLMRLDTSPYEAPESQFYATDAFTDYAIQFVEESFAKREHKPFFLYLAYNAPHYPLQALPEDISKYRDKFLSGWDELRQQRHLRLKKLGIIDRECRLAARDRLVKPWTSLTVREQEQQAQLMAVYAAMVDRMDSNIGRLLDRIQTLGVNENTVVIFLSDNGACPFDRDRTPQQSPGPRDAERSYNTQWANVSNTPLRMYKRWNHEGGIAAPFIVRWPAHIQSAGQICRSVGHVIDLMPTLLEIAGSNDLSRNSDQASLPLEGVSLVPVWHGTVTERSIPIFWEYNGHRAVRVDHWKLVADQSQDWELYDLRKDRSESHNLSAKFPQRVAEMSRQYDAWASRVGAMSNQQAVSMSATSRQVQELTWQDQQSRFARRRFLKLAIVAGFGIVVFVVMGAGWRTYRCRRAAALSRNNSPKQTRKAA
jgi:arylsulfatase